MDEFEPSDEPQTISYMYNPPMDIFLKEQEKYFKKLKECKEE